MDEADCTSGKTLEPCEPRDSPGRLAVHLPIGYLGLIMRAKNAATLASASGSGAILTTVSTRLPDLDKATIRGTVMTAGAAFTGRLRGFGR